MNTAARQIDDPSAREHARLAALAEHDIIDSAAEPEFDAIARLAAQICDTRFAFISLMDERRLWIKSSVGMDVQSLPHENTLCQSVVTGGRRVGVSDATQDPRFAGLPAVTSDPHVRFYLGTPLTVEGGHCLGSLCVFDTIERTPQPTQQTALDDLALLTIRLIEQRSQKRKAEIRQAMHDITERKRYEQAGTSAAVEDDESIRAITRIALETLGGLTLLSCADGQSAIAEAAAFQLGLLLIDVMMPGLDGPATLKELSGVLSVDQIPVVFMTAKSQLDDHLSYYALGVSAVIVKPFDPMTLATQIQAIWQSFHE